MTLGIFTTHGNSPYKPDDGCMLDQALSNYNALADEVLLVDGYASYEKTSDNRIGREWPYEFTWEQIGKNFQAGYDALGTSWAVHADLDFIFHERDFGKIRQALKDYPTAPAVSFYKWQMIQPDRYNLKSRLLLAVNKGKFGDRITFSGGGDGCQPQLDGKDLDLNEMPQAGVPFWNYEHLTKTKEQITEDIERMDRAWQRHFGEWLYSKDGKSAYDGWLEMVVGRYNKPSAKLKIEDHPKVMQRTIRELKPEQFGYNGFGNFDGGYFA